MPSFSHDCILVIDKPLMNVLESFLSLRCDLSVRLGSDLIDMLVWESHIHIRFEHFYGSL